MKKNIVIAITILILCVPTNCVAATKYDRYTSFMKSTQSIHDLYITLLNELDYFESMNGKLDETEALLYFVYAKAYLLNEQIWTGQSAAMMYTEIPDWTTNNISSTEMLADYIDSLQQRWLNGEMSQADAIPSGHGWFALNNPSIALFCPIRIRSAFSCSSISMA